MNIEKNKVLSSVHNYAICKNQNRLPFKPGLTKVTTGGAVFGPEESIALATVALDMWLTSGPWSLEFEKSFAEYLGVKYCILTNSGSSANLLAFSALTSPNLGDRRIKKGDEVITVAAGFPTTVNPIIQFGAIPVFVDVDLDTLNINVKQAEEAITSKTKAIMIAHTLGNPFNLGAIKELCDRHNLWLIEDCCDALGSEYNGQKVASFGDIATFSFFPAHQITMGEGGAVVTSNSKLKRNIESFRDWGKACWCPPGTDNCCRARHCMKSGELPFGYDHKYTFTHFGYNLKATEMQAAIGVEQLKKIDKFNDIRRRNFNKLVRLIIDDRKAFKYLSYQYNEQETNTRSPFGFAMTLTKDAPFTRAEFVKFLEDNQIQTRMLFGGNLIKHPAFDEMRASGEGFRVVGDLKNTDYILENTLWIGCHHGLTIEMIEYSISKIKEFLCQYDQ